MRRLELGSLTTSLALVLTACGGGGVTTSGADSQAELDGSSSQSTDSGDGDPGDGDPGDGDGDPGDGDGDPGDGDPGDGDGDPGDGDGDDTEGPKFDIGFDGDVGDGPPPGRTCKVVDDMDAVGDCDQEAPPDSFEPALQWSWPGQDGEDEIMSMPVVANLTDDNEDGEIDLCDIPDVVVNAYVSVAGPGHLYVFDGETGALHFKIEDAVGSLVYPAIANLDDDEPPEIIAATADGYIAAWEHDGTLKFKGTTNYPVNSAAIAVADIDHDGDVEIVHHGHVFDHEGNTLWIAPNSGSDWVNAIADLDGDDDMEILMGPTAYTFDGMPYYSVGIGAAHPQVADLDEDGLPEVLLVAGSGITILEHDGSPKVMNQVSNLASWRPAAVHDVDGDDQPEIMVGASNNYSVLETDLSANWTAAVLDSSGYAGGTGFDFLGDGTAEAMYADETTLYIYDEVGMPLLTQPRSSLTQWEYPVVVDVDNDGSAEIIVVSNGGGQSPPLQVIRDQDDRWIQARRIWNQHTYHVTNVREDGSIPQFEPKSWELLNTYRTQAQISPDGGVCQPDPQG